jgi:hypothetical protein
MSSTFHRYDRIAFFPVYSPEMAHCELLQVIWYAQQILSCGIKPLSGSSAYRSEAGSLIPLIPVMPAL